jgi:UDP-N-acetylmuramate: L-alanyl-gamma-D-glutamyl-meso-diaminopimelate ligase
VIAGVFFKTTDPLKPEERLDVDRVVADLNARGVAAVELPDVAAILSSVIPRLAAGDVLAILSNGGFDDIYEKLPAALQLHVGKLCGS